MTNTETNLKNLTEFVESEKKRLGESEKILNELKNEEEMLKPIVEGDRNTVESILQLQNQKAQESLSTERWIAFVLGIVASIIASIVWTVAKYFYQLWQKKRLKTREAINS